MHAVYKRINNQEEKDKIITVGATIAFSEPESGFVTRKEGTGGDDNTEAILRVIIPTFSPTTILTKHLAIFGNSFSTLTS